MAGPALCMARVSSSILDSGSIKILMRGGEAETQLAHNQQNAGAIPAPATIPANTIVGHAFENGTRPDQFSL